MFTFQEDDEVSRLSLHGGGPPLLRTVFPVGGAIASICPKDRPPRQWFSLVDADAASKSDSRHNRGGSGPGRGSSGIAIDQLSSWWTETAWKDSMCLNSDSLQSPVDETTFKVSHEEARVATKVISFDEYDRVAIFGLFKDETETLHFLIVWANRSQLVYFQSAIEWATDYFKTIVVNAYLAAQQESEQAVAQQLGQGMVNLTESLRKWCVCMKYPLQPPLTDRSVQPWERMMMECCDNPKRMQTVADVVSLALSRLKVVLVAKKSETVQMWLDVLSLFLPVHRIHLSTRHVVKDMMELSTGVHVQGVETEKDPFHRDGAPFRDGLLHELEHVPLIFAGCVMVLDHAAGSTEAGKLQWARVTQDGKGWTVPEQFKAPEMVVEMVETVCKSVKRLRPDGTSWVQSEWNTLTILLQQFREQMMQLALEMEHYLNDPKTFNNIRDDDEDNTFFNMVRTSVNRKMREEQKVKRAIMKDGCDF